MYQAKIYFEAYEDSYTEGETTDCTNSWQDTLTDSDPERLKQKIIDATYTKWEDIEQDDINDHPNQTEYWTSYHANADNVGNASDAQIEQWKAGKCRLWAIHCQILVSKLTEKRYHDI